MGTQFTKSPRPAHRVASWLSKRLHNILGTADVGVLLGEDEGIIPNP